MAELSRQGCAHCAPSSPVPSTTGSPRLDTDESGDADLHLRHHRPAQGCPAGPRQLGLRGRGDRRLEILFDRRRAVPVAAAVARVRQGAARGPAADRLRHRGRRQPGQDRGEPGSRAADVHGRRPADLREGSGQGHPDRPGRGRPQGQDLRLGDRRRRRRPSREPAGAPQPRGPAQGASSGWPTSWCSARSAAGSAARIRFFVSGSAALSKRRSPNGSTPSG